MEATSKHPPVPFSLIIEGFTITEENAETLRTSLASLASQSVRPATANEVLLMETGHVPRELLEDICAPYPWVDIVSLSPGTMYFNVKLAGAERASGEVVVFADADNEYLPGWLESMLAPFAGRPADEVNIVTGETSVDAVSLYGTVFALTFFFPPFTNQDQVVDTHTYFGNNVAFRRSFLLEHPIPTGLPLLRGNDFVHSVRLRRRGCRILRQPRAKAFHDPPDSLEEFVLRYLARGSDRLEIWRLTRDAAGVQVKHTGRTADVRGFLRVMADNLADFGADLLGVPRQTPRALLYYPLAVPLGLLLLGLTFLGGLISSRRPGVLVGLYLDHYTLHT